MKVFTELLFPPSGGRALRGRRPPRSSSAQAAFLQKLLENLPQPRAAAEQAKISDWLRSLRNEKDPEIFFLQLLHVGRAMKNNGEEATAGAIFQAFFQEAVPSEIKKAAEEELQAMTGQGKMGLRVEYLSGRFLADCSDAKTILPMIAGTAFYSIARAAALGRLATTVRATAWTRGLGARFTASLIGTAFEIPTFAWLSRGMQQMAGTPVRENLWEDLSSAGITLSALKLSSFVGKMAGGALSSRPLQVLAAQSSTFFGLLAAHQVEEFWQLRARVDGATTVTDTLSSMVSMGIGAHLGQKALGSKFAAWQREVEWRSQRTSDSRPAPIRRGGPLAETSAAGPARVPASGNTGLILRNSLDPWRMARRSDNKGPTGSGLAPRTPAPSSATADALLDSLRQRAAALPAEVVAEVQGRLGQEWSRWEGKEGLAETTQRNIEAIVPHYARYSLALLGRETPTHLNFVREVFEVALEACRAADPEINWGDSDRLHFNRFLSTQEGRRDAGVGHEGSQLAALRLPGISFERAREVLQDVYPRWERFLRAEADQIQCTPLQRAQIYQRGRSLMHFYASYLYAAHVAIPESRLADFDPSNPHTIYQLDLILQTLQDASRHPYPAETLAILERFFREELRIDISRGLAPERPTSLDPAELSLQPLELAPLRYLQVPTAEGLGACLAQLGIDRSFFPLGWSPTANTLFSYGNQRDPKGRPRPPGDILDLNAAVHLVNAEHSRAIDPFDAVKAAIPQQLALLNPDAEGRIVIRYTQLMAGLSYAHFGVGSLLQAYKHAYKHEAIPSDAAVGHQVRKSEGTVGRYRRGTKEKMQISGLEPLAKGLVVDDPLSEAQMLSLLYFLRYRAYFDANMPVEDADGNPLNSTPAHPSQYRVVLVPHDVQLRPLDLTQRIRFEREPFASAINGTVDLALRLLENRCGEFAMLDYRQLHLAEGAVTLGELQRRIDGLRDQHGAYFQLLSQHERNPGVVRPGQLREIQNFYRHLFRFFEAVHLYARPEGEFRIGNAMVSFEVVPMTAEQPSGVRIRPHPRNPDQQRAYVVAADLLESARHASDAERGNFLRMRVMCAFLRSLNLMIEDPIYERENRRLLQVALAANRIEASDALVNEFFRLEALAELVRLQLDYTTEAILHRVTRGHLSDTSRVRRVRHWEQDLEAFALHRSLGSGAAEALAQVFHAYLELVPQPFRGFSPTRLQEALSPVAIRFGESFAAEIAGHCRDFMRSVGLPLEDAAPVPAIPLSVQGLAEIALAGYLHHCRNLHPLGAAGRVVPDPTLMERVVDERLVDFPHLIPQRDAILRELERLLTDYNRRPSLLRVYELHDATLSANRNWQYRLLPLLYARAVEAARGTDPDIAEKLSPALLNGAVAELAPILSESSEPSRADLELALSRMAERLADWGVEIPPGALEVMPEILGQVTRDVVRCMESLDRLATLIPNFVQDYRARSGLVPIEQMGAQSQEIYRRYFRRSLLEADPPELQEVILEVAGRPVDPYSHFREDVVREMTTLFFMGLGFLRNQYDQIESALELSAAEPHRNENQFWQSFFDFAATGEPGLQSRRDLETRISDYERFLSLFPFAPTPELATRIAAALVEIEQKNPPLQIEAILSVPIPSTWLEAYPELELASPAALGEVLQQYGSDAPVVTRPEGRALLQLLAYWYSFQRNLSGLQIQRIEECFLEIQTDSGDAEALTQRIFAQVGEMQREILSQIPALDRLRCLPQFRPGGKLLSPIELGSVLLGKLVNAQLPPRVERSFWKICLDVQRFLMELQTAQVAESVPGLEAAIQLQFYRVLASLTSDELATVEAASPFVYASTGGKPLRPENVPQELRDRVALEAPEVFLVTDTGFEQHLQGQYARWNQGRPPIAEDYALEKIVLLILNDFFSSLSSAKSEIWARYSLKNFLINQGLDPGLVAARLTEPMLALYREYRPEIRKAIIDREGVNILLHLLPEIQAQETHLLNVNSLEVSTLAPGNMEGFPISKVLHVLAKLPLPPNRRKAVDQFLWDFEPPDLAALHADKFSGFLAESQNRLAHYYLKNREELLPLSQTAEAVAVSRRRSVEEWLAELWELHGLPAPLRIALEETLPANGRAALAKFQLGKDQFLVDYNLDVSSSTVLRGSAILSAEKKRALEAAQQLEKTYPLDYPGKAEIRPGENISFQPANLLTAYNVAISVLSPWPVNTFKGNLSIAGKTVSAKAEKISQRADLLLFLGADPEWVLAQYEERLFQLYSGVRESIVRQIDFIPPVSGLPEVAGVPHHVLISEAKDATGLLRWADYPGMEVFLRIQALVNNAARQNPDLTPLTMEILLGTGPARGQGTRKDPRRVKSLDHPRAVAQEYLRHQEKFLPHLGPWPQAPRYADAVDEVAGLLEIVMTEFRGDEDIQRYFEKTGTPLDESTADFFRGRDAFVYRITARMHELAHLGHPDFLKKYERMMVSHQDLSDDEQREKIAEWYRETRPEIMQRIKG